SNVSVFYRKITRVEKVMRLVAGVTFILTGMYYILIFAEIL
ncbi:MAG TPA: cytochrome C biogenesis protein, partial [Flavobacteriales bacterium]|nr:cytochrome C biogenesis protein [Flavobacteriales bacterium]